MSKLTLPRLAFALGGVLCWAEHSVTRVHCTLPPGHGGGHWHPYSRTSW